MSMEKKVISAEQKAFNKLWAKKIKLSPMVKSLRKDIGKASKCSIKK